MLGWIKKPDGFGIRTAIKPRLERLRQRVVTAGRSVGPLVRTGSGAAVAGLRAAGSRTRAAAVATVAGLRAAATAAPDRARAGLAVTGSGARRMLVGLAASGPALWQKLRTVLRSVLGFLARPYVVGISVAAGAMALGAGIGRYRGAGLDSEVIAMLAIGGVLMATLLPLAGHRLAGSFPKLAWLSPGLGLATAAVAAVLAAGAVWSAYRVTSGFAGIGASREVVGRASVVAGDLLKVSGVTVRLSGVEAPEREQRCGKDINKWRCAEAAQSALWKVVSGRPVRCRLSGSDKSGHPLALCSIDSVDINAELVRQGHVFAEGGALGRYGALEREARTAKGGMWIGDADRPAEFRAKAWEEAKRRAPDGCPIKGQVTGPERVYVLPGTPDYERVRIRASRGDRWFCSEQEAAEAGFKAAQRG